MSDVQLDKVSPAPRNGHVKGAAQSPIWRMTPQCDLYETDNEYLLVMDLPGTTVESLSVQRRRQAAADALQEAAGASSRERL